MSADPKRSEQVTCGHVNESDATSEIRIRFALVDKSVLTPIADHQAQPQKHEGQQQCKSRSTSVDVVGHAEHECIARHLRQKCSDGETRLVLTEKIERQLNPDE